MKITTFFIALLLALALPAHAELGKINKQAYEVKLGTMRMPATESGSLAFKQCEDCEYMTRLVSPATQWKINEKTVSLKDFKARLRRIADRNKTSVTVVHHLESDRITEVAVLVHD